MFKYLKRAAMNATIIYKRGWGKSVSRPSLGPQAGLLIKVQKLELDPSHGAHPGEEDEAAQIPLAME